MAMVPRRASPKSMPPTGELEAASGSQLMVIDDPYTPTRALFGTIEAAGTPYFPMGMPHIMVAEETVGVFVNRLNNVEKELSKITELGIQLDQDIEVGYRQLQGMGQVQTATVDEIRAIQNFHYEHLRLTRELDQTHQTASAHLRETIQALHEHHQQQAQEASAQVHNLGTFVNESKINLENEVRQKDSNLDQRL